MRVTLRVCLIIIVKCFVVPSWTQWIIPGLNITIKSTPAYPKFSDYIDETLPLKAVKTYCPGVNGCYTNVPEHPTYDVYGEVINNTKCCLPCRCDKLCFVRGDCCFDLALNKTMSDAAFGRKQIFACTTTTVPESNSASDTFHHNYMLIEKCALTHSNATVRRKCESPETSKLSEMTPYTYTVNKLSYKNVWCLRCNMFSVNPGTIVPWKMQVDCPKELGDKGLHRRNVTYNEDNFLDGISNDNCTVSWHPPLHYSVDVCYPHIISECMLSDDQALVDLCEAFDSVFAPFEGVNGLFKNIYCASCNGERITDPKSYLMFYCDDNKKRTLSILTVMINLEFISQTFSRHWLIKKDEKNTTSAHGCNYDEIYVAEVVSQS